MVKRRLARKKKWEAAMALAVQFLGGVIAIIGAIGLMFGLEALPTERGMAWTAASATAIAGGAITFAIGTATSRLDALSAALTRGTPARAGVEGPSAVVVQSEPLRPVVRQDPAIEPPPVMPDPVAAPVAAPVAPAAERPKFQLPSLSFGKVGAAAGAATVTAGAALAASRETAEQAVADAIQTLRHTDPAPPVAVAAPEPVDPPIEVLTPVIDDAHPIADAPEEPALPAHDALAAEAAPATATPVGDDPLAAFEQELDRLIPLKSLRGKKGRKDQKPEMTEPPAPESDLAPAPVAAAAPQDEPAPEIPAAPMPADEPAPTAEVVGAYESGGAKYTMYSDGSVVAEAEGQTLYFKSLEDLRDFIDGGVKPA